MTNTWRRMDFTHQETIVLLNIYKKFPILWDPKARGYHDRKLKANAWNEISTEVKVHPEICKRKIDSLFASYRREKRKLDKSRKNDAPDDVMTPKWRFWNAFRFVRGLTDDDEDPLGDGPEVDTSSCRDVTSWSTSKMLAHKHRKVEMSPLPSKPSSSLTTGKESPETQNAKEKDDEYTAIGITVEAKLRKMSYDQKLFAENIINQALYKGLLFQLTELSEIRTTDFPPGYYLPKEKSGRNQEISQKQKPQSSKIDRESVCSPPRTSVKRRISSEASGNSSSEGYFRPNDDAILAQV